MPALKQLLKTLSQGVITATLSIILASCGGDDHQDDFDRDFTLLGMGVDGPLTFTNVAMYTLLDASGASVTYSSATPGTPVATGTTNQFAQIENLLLNDGINPPYILEFTSTNTTRDLTTGAAPVLSTVRTLVTEEMLDAGDPVYASPLTTIVLDIALSTADASDGVITLTEFQSALTTATSQVKSTLGLGMDASFDIFTTPPVLDSTVASNDAAALQQVAIYRSAIEAARILVGQISELVGATGDTVLATFASDLADGVIDGQVDGALAELYLGEEQKNEALDLLEQAVDSLCVVDDGAGECLQTVADINALLVDERADIGVDASASVQIDAPDLNQPRLSSDSDGDGINNDQDAFPDNAQETIDTDADGVGDSSDNCPAASNADQADTDSDGVGDVCDTATTPDADTDDDGVNDGVDNCPSVANTDQLNTDNDTQGNACDSDDDGDGVSDSDETTQGSNPLLNDSDGDGDNDGADNCVLVANADQLNSDSDSQGNVCDTDDDNDGTPDSTDDFPLDADETTDTDDDGIGNNTDNCPSTANEDQLNTDGTQDGGNACDADDDNDDTPDATDNCPLFANGDQENTDGDTQGNLCDDDDDNDGLTDAQEASYDFLDPTSPNDANTDYDGDGLSNAKEIAMGFDPAQADASFPIDLTRYFPLGEILWSYKSDSAEGILKSTKGHKENVFIFSGSTTRKDITTGEIFYRYEESATYEVREDGIYLLQSFSSVKNSSGDYQIDYSILYEGGILHIPFFTNLNTVVTVQAETQVQRWKNGVEVDVDVPDGTIYRTIEVSAESKFGWKSSEVKTIELSIKDSDDPANTDAYVADILRLGEGLGRLNTLEYFPFIVENNIIDMQVTSRYGDSASNENTTPPTDSTNDSPTRETEGQSGGGGGGSLDWWLVTLLGAAGLYQLRRLRHR